LACKRLWFSPNDAIASHIRREFEPDWVAFINESPYIGGDYSELCHDPHGALSLIVLGSQFTRRMYPESPRQFEHDDKIRMISWTSFHEGVTEQLDPIDASFFYFPLFQAESVSSVETCVMKAQKELLPSAPLIYKPYLRLLMSYMQEHARVIKLFGRYPSRNALLGRPSTSEENKFLQNDKSIP